MRPRTTDSSTLEARQLWHSPLKSPHGARRFGLSLSTMPPQGAARGAGGARPRCRFPLPVDRAPGRPVPRGAAGSRPARGAPPPPPQSCTGGADRPGARGRRRRSRPAMLPRGKRGRQEARSPRRDPAFARRALCGMSGALRRPRRLARGGAGSQARCSARLKGRADRAGAMGGGARSRRAAIHNIRGRAAAAP